MDGVRKNAVYISRLKKIEDFPCIVFRVLLRAPSLHKKKKEEKSDQKRKLQKRGMEFTKTQSPPPNAGGGGGPSPNFAAAAETPIQTTTAPSTTTTTSDDLPRAHVKRIMKHQLAKFAHVDAKTNAPFEPHIAKDALDGVQQACKIFIHYVTSTANDICTESKRSTLSAVRSLDDDGFLNFPHFFLFGRGMSSSSFEVFDDFYVRTMIIARKARGLKRRKKHRHRCVGCVVVVFSFSFSL